jgi:tetratricopeptide (TPR) repeat protein
VDTEDPALEIESAVGLGVTAFYRGRLQEAIRLLSSAVERYRVTPVVTPFQRFQHPAVAGLSHLMLAHWLMGDAEQAHSAAVATTDLADSCEEHLRWFAREYAHTFRAAHGAYSGEASSCLRHAQQAIDVCHQYGSQMFLAGAEIYKGYGQVGLGALDEGSARLEAACESYLRTGATLFRPYHLTLLARARSVGGDHGRALDVLDAAVELAEQNGELVHLPMVLAERGRTLRALAGDEAAARVDEQRALDLADELGIDRHVVGPVRETSAAPKATGGTAMQPAVAVT